MYAQRAAVGHYELRDLRAAASQPHQPAITLDAGAGHANTRPAA